MTLKEINRLIPYKKLLFLLFLFALAVQTIIITYNHYTGYFHLTGTADFLIRLSYSTVLSFVASIFLAYPDLMIIQHLNKTKPWNRKSRIRLLLQMLFTIVIGVLAATLITFTAHSIDSYEEPLWDVIINNILIMIVVNLILMTVLEAAVFSHEAGEQKRRAASLTRELDRIRFEVLKSQINPHFLFNSLNVLSGLVHSDADKAQDFIDEFSHLYRYVLDSIEKQVVTLESELDFINSYMFLQKTRYGKNVDYHIDIPAGMLTKRLPPLSLQIVFENAIKHNRIDDAAQLDIRVAEQSDSLIVVNNYQPKVSRYHKTGIGLSNLSKRYELIGCRIPQYRVKENEYIVELPLINQHHYEGNYH